jgi:UDPglucose--hexose-1-phosphate uridylyltransferase
MTSPSELRKDPVSGRWVIIAAERSKRPDDFRPAKTAERLNVPTPFCPFCAGNEAKTPPEIFSLAGPRDGTGAAPWRVRVVPNKFPAVSRGEAPARVRHGLFESMPGIGVHEVVIESPDHDREMADLPVDHVRDILATFQARLRSIEAEPQYAYIQLFKNKGMEAGASLSHPHTQIVALPIIPKRVKEEIYSSERYFRRTRGCLFCRSLAEELAAGERIVLKNDHFAAVEPFASRFPFETRIFPLRHAPFLSGAGPEEIASLAETLSTVLRKLKSLLADPAYNLVLHQSPNPACGRRLWPELEHIAHWYLEIIPVLTHVAGFEWGTGFYINPVAPESAAKFLRD